MKSFIQANLAKAANLVGRPLDAASPTAGIAHPGNRSSEWPHKNDPVLEHLLRDFRSANLRKHFFSHPAKEYTDTLDVKVLAGTYNVAGKKPPPGLKLHDWLDQWKDCWPSSDSTGGSEAAAGPDIVAVGFQEVVPLSAGNVIAGPSSDGADAWDYVLASTLNGDDWAGRNYGRTFGSAVASQAVLLNLGAQAYNLISSQAANVVGAMDKMWSGSPNGNGSGLQQGPNASDEQQQARLALALASTDDGENVYVQVVCKQLVGVYISVWARKRLARNIRGVQATSAATGFGGYLGNKGAVAVRMRVYDAALVVVCSHLASGDADGDELKRNSDVADIMRRCVFTSDTQPADAVGQQQLGVSSNTRGGGGGSISGGHWGNMVGLMDHDNVVWLGDLNYRLVCSDEEARRCIRAGKLESLLRHDQLTREMAAGRVFQGWREGPISFYPTYKYHLGCNIYSGEPLPAGVVAVRAVDSSTSLADSSSDVTGEGESLGAASGRDSPSVEKQKKRTPAWCDRVLWLPGRQLYQLAYGRGEVAVSDHRPVAAAFLLEAHRYDRDAVHQLAETARRAVDMSDNAIIPRCNLSPNFIEMQLVPFGTPQQFAVRLANVGTTSARYYFVPPPKPRMSADGQMAWDDDQPLCPTWLHISPVEGEVAAGEAATITLTAHITGGGAGSAAAHIAANPPKPPAPVNTLDTILILRLEDGADSFISCHGLFLPSCFGMDLDALLTLGDSPVLAVEDQLAGEAGQALLQQGLAAPAGTAGAAGGAGQVADLLGVQMDELALNAAAGGSSAAGGAADSSAGAAATAAAGGTAGSAGDAQVLVTGLEDRVPKEVQRLVNFLQVQQRLHTPGLFVDSIQACCSNLQPGKAPRSAAQLQQLLAATAPVRWALDTGLDWPEHVTVHQVAAALLLLLHQLPECFMPPDVSAILMHCVPPAPSCSSLLSDAMSAVEWATLRHVLALCRAALAPAAAAANGLTTYSLAGLLAEYLFGGLAVAVPPELAANQVAFLMTLLDPESAVNPQAVAAAAAAADPPAAWMSVPPPVAPLNQRGTSVTTAAVLRTSRPPQESLI